jgi:hydrogenase/urease accessory protein HupE
LRKAVLLVGLLSAVTVNSHPLQVDGDISALGIFYTGLLHPFLAPTHVLAMAGTGLLIGQLPREMAAIPLIVFVATYCGALLATLWEAGWAASTNALMILAAVTGFLVALGSPAVRRLVIAIAAISGILLGLNSATEGSSWFSNLLLTLGTFLGGALAVMAFAALTLELPYKWQRIGVRVVGSWTAASSILVLALALSRLK